MQKNGGLVKNNKAATSNQTGGMVGNISDISKRFIYDSEKPSTTQTIYDIGCSYGIVSLTLLERSKCQVIALDASEKHIELMNKFIDFKKLTKYLQLHDLIKNIH